MDGDYARSNPVSWLKESVSDFILLQALLQRQPLLNTHGHVFPVPRRWFVQLLISPIFLPCKRTFPAIAID